MNIDGFIEDEAGYFDNLNLSVQQLEQLQSRCSSRDFQKMYLNEPAKIPTLVESLLSVGLEPVYHSGMSMEQDLELLRASTRHMNCLYNRSYRITSSDPTKEVQSTDAVWTDDKGKHIEASWGFNLQGQLIRFSSLFKKAP